MPGYRLLRSVQCSEHHMAHGLATWPRQLPDMGMLLDLATISLHIVYRHVFDPMWQGMRDQPLHLAGVQVIGCPENSDTFSCFFGKFHGPRKVENRFRGRASAYRHCSLCNSLDLRLWFTRLSHGVRPLPTAQRATSCPSLAREDLERGLACALASYQSPLMCPYAHRASLAC